MAATASDGVAHKQWTSSSHVQVGQACPEPGGGDSALSKTVSTEKDAPKEHENNQNLTTLSPSGYKDTPIVSKLVLVVKLLMSVQPKADEEFLKSILNLLQCAA